MFTTSTARISVRPLLLIVPFFFLVGCGPSAVTYATKDEAVQNQQKAKAEAAYLKNATPEQKAAIEARSK